MLVIAAAFVGRNIIDNLSYNTGQQTEIILLFVVLIFVAIIRTASQKVTQYAHTMQGEIIDGKMALVMMHHSIHADIEHFDNPEYYDRLKSASQDSMAVSYIIWSIISAMSAMVGFLSASVILFNVNPVYGVVMVVGAIPSSIISAKYSKSLYTLGLEQINQQRQLQYSQYVATEKSFAQDIRLFNAGAKLTDRYNRIWSSLFADRKKVTRRRTILTAILECLPEVIVVAIGIDIAFGVIGGQSTVGDYVLFTGLASQLWFSMGMLSAAALQIYDNKLRIENIKKLDTFTNRIVDNGTLTLDTIDNITFDNVCFTYPGTTTMVSNNINFSIAKNEKVVIVGLNGSGKSTLIKLLLRMYEVDSGAILINGKNIKAYSLQSLRSNFSTYFQEMQNYNFTLKENFEMADESGLLTEQHMWDAIEKAQATDVSSKAGNDLGRYISRQFSPTGIELSGGQHQKLALARTLFRNHTALILDEPSSNLDPRAEHDLFKALEKFTNGKITIFTSHRLTNVVLADRILVFEKGQLIEDGTQEELLKNKHRYAELYKYQQEKYGGA